MAKGSEEANRATATRKEDEEGVPRVGEGGATLPSREPRRPRVSQDRARDRDGDEIRQDAHGGDFIEGRDDDRGGRDLGRKGDRDQVTDHTRRTVERAEYRPFYEGVQGIPEEQDAKHGCDRELECAAVDEERVIGEDRREHRRRKVQRRDLAPEKLCRQHERGDHPGPDGGGWLPATTM